MRFWRAIAVIVPILAVSAIQGKVPEPQTGRSSIAGKVIDLSGSILQGAQVQLLPKGVSVASNEQGEFGFTNLAPELTRYQLLTSGSRRSVRT
jgi:hypothetical protein